MVPAESRRSFLAATAKLATSALAAPAFGRTATELLFRISLAQWSLHRALSAKKLDHLDFAVKAKQDFGIEAVEYVNSFFRDKATDHDYLTEMNRRAGDHGVAQLLIMIDGEGALGAASFRDRFKAVENHYRWVAAARELGCHSVRVNAASEGSYEDQAARAADGLRALTEFGEEHEISVIVENHGGLSSNGEWLASVIRKVDHPRCGTLPDFGNFRLSRDEWYDRYKGVRELMPFAKAVSAKSHEFDDQGNEKRTDYRRMMKIVLDAGYRGWVGIEYEGSQLSEDDGIRATKQLLVTIRDELA